jgi:hypothetical protein
VLLLDELIELRSHPPMLAQPGTPSRVRRGEAFGSHAHKRQ